MKVTKRQHVAAAILQLSNLPIGDPEAAHSKADEILLTYLRVTGASGIADAYEDAVKRHHFYYA